MYERFEFSVVDYETGTVLIDTLVNPMKSTDLKCLPDMHLLTYIETMMSFNPFTLTKRKRRHNAATYPEPNT